jgi:hypothetical protein
MRRGGEPVTGASLLCAEPGCGVLLPRFIDFIT